MTAINVFSRRKQKKVDSHNQHKVEYPEVVQKVVFDSDIILEILDSRFWKETRNFEIEKDIKKKGKKIIFVLNKSDLADKKKIKSEMANHQIQPYVFVSCKDRRGSSELRKRIKIEAKKIDKKRVYVGLIGYPNTGKSSIINLLKGNAVARVASEAGFTKGMQKVRISEGILLIDTPGVIPSYEDSNKKNLDLFKHVQINVRTWDKVKEPEMIVYYLMRKYPRIIENFYEINANGDSEILLEELGRKKRFLLKGNETDSDRTARLILRDFQEGKIKF